MKKTLLLFLALFVTTLTALAEQVTLTWNGQSDWTGIGNATISYTQGAYTLTAVKNDGSTNPTVNGSAGDLRVYAKGSLTVASTGEMTQIVFNISAQGRKRLTDITASAGSVVADTEAWTVTWTGAAKEVTFTVGEKATLGTEGADKAGQFDISSIVVAGEGGDPVTPVDPVDPVEPEKKHSIFKELFEVSQGDFTVEDKALAEGLNYVWSHDATYGYMKASAYVSGTNYEAESWLVSPVIDLAGNTACELQFEHTSKFFSNIAEDVKVMVRAEGGEWTAVVPSAYPTNADWKFVDAVCDLSAFDGGKIQVAFVYTSTAAAAGTWEVKDVKVVGYKDVPSVEVPAPVITPAGGAFVGSVEVCIEAAEGCKIYYCLDETQPDGPTSIEYTAPFTLTETCMVKAVAIDADGNRSEAVVAKFTIKPSLVLGENEVAFDFNSNSWGLPVSDNTESFEVTGPIESDGVKLTTVSGTTVTRMWNDFTNGLQLRTYKNGTLTFTAPEGLNIIKIAFNASKCELSSNVEAWDAATRTWEGKAPQVTFTAGGTTNINYVVVTLDGKPTGIDTVNAGNQATKVIYTLDGRRVDEAGKGIFIINGKKVIK